MSLVGIKDMSLIEDRRRNRYPVQTYGWNRMDELIRDAIQRELAGTDRFMCI
jgi:transcription-repair coupling factor (superfamily II helicase)